MVNLNHSKSQIQVIFTGFGVSVADSPIRLKIDIFDSVSTGNSKLDEARRKREEKKIQRQRELEARRVARGPLKLGAKKL